MVSQEAAHFNHKKGPYSGQARSGAQRNASMKPPLGTISVILATLRRTGSQPSKVMSIALPSAEGSSPDPKRSRMEVRLTLSFSDKDKVGTLQPHDDTLVVTLKIARYDVKRMELIVFLRENIDVFV